MELHSELQQLLERQGEIRRAMRQPGGIRVTVERELFAIGEKLRKFPAVSPNPGAAQVLASEFVVTSRKQ
jgi:hypothetical protein